MSVIEFDVIRFSFLLNLPCWLGGGRALTFRRKEGASESDFSPFAEQTENEGHSFWCADRGRFLGNIEVHHILELNFSNSRADVSHTFHYRTVQQIHGGILHYRRKAPTHEPE